MAYTSNELDSKNNPIHKSKIGFGRSSDAGNFHVYGAEAEVFLELFKRIEDLEKEIKILKGQSK